MPHSDAIVDEVGGINGVWEPLVSKIEVVVEISNAIAGVRFPLVDSERTSGFVAETLRQHEYTL